MKRRIVPVLCALFLSVAASNGAHAITKQELSNNLAEVKFTIKGVDKKLNATQLARVNKFLDECGTLTADQCDAMLFAVGELQSLTTKDSNKNKTLQELNKDKDVIKLVNSIIQELGHAFEGTNFAIALGMGLHSVEPFGLVMLN